MTPYREPRRIVPDAALLHAQSCAGRTRAARPVSLTFKASDKAGSRPDLHGRPSSQAVCQLYGFSVRCTFDQVNSLNAARTIELIDAVLGHLMTSSDRSRNFPV